MGSCLSGDGGGGGSTAPPSPSPSKRVRRGGRRRAREEQLQIPGRAVGNGYSGLASLFTQQGKKGTNQDAMIVWENFGSWADTVFCGVFDGHGPFGHLVARRVRDSLPPKLCANWEVNIAGEDCRENSISRVGSMNSEETASVCMDEEPQASDGAVGKEMSPEIFMTLKDSFLKSFKAMDKELKVHPNIDCFCSGTTAVTLVKKGQDLVIGNVGDSRAVLGSRNQDDTLIAVQLTVDLKPNLPREAERIRKCKGRVFALQDEPDVARVWLPNYDSPGLAMARAFGDFCLKDFGLISVPEISYHRLTERDEFVVLATDGIWDVLSNKEVVDIVASAPARSSVARLLVESAVRAWRFKYPTSKIDDCAVVCLFFDSNMSDTYSIPKTKVQSCMLGMTEPGESKQELCSPTTLERSRTVRSCSHSSREESKEAPDPMAHSHHQSFGGNVPAPEGNEWSALEGVSRVNTLLTLPRFVAGEKQSASSRKRA